MATGHDALNTTGTAAPIPPFGLAGLPAGPVDHGWLGDGRGVLSCIAGDRHTADAIAVCPYYLRHDVIARLPADVRPPRPSSSPSLTYRGEPYEKITALAQPPRWRSVVSALAPNHGLRTSAWSLFSVLDAAHAINGIDPRDALRAVVAAHHGRRSELLLQLLEAVGDPGAATGVLGLTGSAALDPGSVADRDELDIVVYPAARAAIEDAIAELGGEFLADLDPADDARHRAYTATRIMPALTDPATQGLLWSRRRDLAWIGDLRLDLTHGDAHATIVTDLAYTIPPTGRFHGEVGVAATDDGYPVRLDIEGAKQAARLLVTARGFQGVLRPGDRLEIAAATHRQRDGTTFLSLDDAANHNLRLRR